MTVFRFLWCEWIAYRVVSGVLGLLLMHSRFSQTGQHLEFESLRCSCYNLNLRIPVHLTFITGNP